MRFIFFGFLFLFYPLHANAEYQFKNFKVSPKLLKKIKQNQSYSKQNTKHLSKLSISSEPLSTGESPLMQEVRKYLQNNHSAIEDEQLEALYQKKYQFNLGVKNYDGLTWQKPMGNFHIYTDRVIEPNSNPGKKWVVNDVLVISIDAQTYLSSLKDEGMIEIGDKELGAFAGLEFRRVYTHKYFANSYDESIESNFEKLLLSFLFFEAADVQFLYPNEILSKEDYLGFHAGGMANIPLDYGFSLTAGFLVKASQLSSITAFSLSELDIYKHKEFLRLYYEKQQSLGVGAELGLKLDFFNLLKLSLLSFEYSYTSTKTEQAEFSFTLDDYTHFVQSTPVNGALKKLMRLQGLEKGVLEDHLRSYSMKRKKDTSYDFKFLNQGSAKESSSEQIVTQVKGKKKEFLDHQTTQLKYKKGWKQTLIDMAIHSLINFDFFQKYEQSHTDITEFQYEINSDEKYTVSLEKHHLVAKTKNSQHKKHKEGMVDFVNNFTLLSRDVSKLIERESLVGPIKVKAIVDIEGGAVEYFSALSKKDKLDRAEQLCYSLKSKKWINPSDACYRKLSRLIKKFEEKKSTEDKLWALKDVLDTVNKYSQNVQHQTLFFHDEMIEIRGVIEAKTNKGQTFKHYYSSGKKRDQKPLSHFLNNDLQLAPQLEFH